MSVLAIAVHGRKSYAMKLVLAFALLLTTPAWADTRYVTLQADGDATFLVDDFFGGIHDTTVLVVTETVNNIPSLKCFESNLITLVGGVNGQRVIVVLGKNSVGCINVQVFNVENPHMNNIQPVANHPFGLPLTFIKAEGIWLIM